MDRVCFDASIAYSRRELRDYLRFPNADCVVAENVEQDAAAPAATKIVGFLVTVRERDEGYIVTIDVLPEYRRHAVGSLLLAEAENRMAARGAREVSLETATDNASAIAFWQKHGYRTRGVKTGYYPGGRDAYSMTKLLPLASQNQKARS
jgi:ribosomal protein S18 acetylase RimI-like enzyme